jgi:hypothetical protein
VRRVLLLFLILAGTALSSGQRVGLCPPNPNLPRNRQNVRELKGVVVDENLAVIPNVKVRLQMPDGKDFRDIGAIETDPTGRFSFEARPPGNYRLVFAGCGFCPATIPVEYSKAGFKGVRLTLPVAASDSCAQDCDRRLRVEEMTGGEGHE